MSSQHSDTIVVGVDGSAASLGALSWAMDLASRQQALVKLVHTVEVSMYDETFIAGYVPAARESGTKAGQSMLDTAVAAAARTHPEVPVSTRIDVGTAAAVLIEESTHAGTVVLGSRGTGGFVDLILGSTTLYVATHAHCPVVAVPQDTEGAPLRHGIVVGVDGSPASDAAIEYAFQAADRAEQPLVAVHAWWDPAITDVSAMQMVFDLAPVEREQRAELSAAIASWSEKYPKVQVESKVVHAHAVLALTEESRTAGLLVVGCRGRGELKSLILGSVSHGVLHHATGPVAVVPIHS